MYMHGKQQFLLIRVMKTRKQQNATHTHNSISLQFTSCVEQTLYDVVFTIKCNVNVQATPMELERMSKETSFYERTPWRFRLVQAYV